jgi:signal transduction histidine kinase
MLRQVMSHLLDNALEYTPAGGQVVVFAEEQRGEEGQEWITLAVQDTGPGLSAEELPRLFDRFYRGEAAANSALPGAGLGLAIAREIVDRLGGRITVASRPGEGATFTVFLRPASPLSLTDR